MKRKEALSIALIAAGVGGASGFIGAQLGKEPPPDVPTIVGDHSKQLADLYDRNVMTNERVNNTNRTVNEIVVFLKKK